MFSTKYFLLACIFFLNCSPVWPLPNVTFDEFFNNTAYLSLTLSPNNDPWILIQTKHSVWDANINEYHLYLYSLDGKEKTLVTRQTTSWSKPLWEGEWIAYMFGDELQSTNVQYTIQLYSTRTGRKTSLALGKEAIHAFTWSNLDTSIYFATRTPWTNESEIAYQNEWKDVIEYRERERGDTIYRVDFADLANIRLETITNISLQVAELICSPDGQRLLFSTGSRSGQMELIKDYEIYSFDLIDPSSSDPRRLTNNQAIERDLKWFKNNSILFTVYGEGSIEGEYRDTQGRLYSLDLADHRIQRWATDFNGAITDYAPLRGGELGVIFLGQLRTNIHVYTQQSPRHVLIQRTERDGSYEKLVASSVGNTSTIAFIYSSFTTPQEVYFVPSLDRLNMAEMVTHENELLTQRNLPMGKSYQWLNKEDRTSIEGTLLYPPDKFQEKNLPLFVLIHGGPYSADVNALRTDWYYCAMMVATEGWLVFQPNYRGSAGYGDQFLHDLKDEILSLPGKDILYGVDALIRDGTADPKRLAVGGYSYGGYLTNWLITQTTRFNAAVTGAGAVENVIDWGTNDIPISTIYLLSGSPWEQPRRYKEEATLFQLNKVRTPTHMVVGENDMRVPVAESYLFERALYFLDIPHEFIILPNEGHYISQNPWHEKIKLREELKWLQKYGHVCVATCDGPLFSFAPYQQMNSFTLFIFLTFLFINK